MTTWWVTELAGAASFLLQCWIFFDPRLSDQLSRMDD